MLVTEETLKRLYEEEDIETLIKFTKASDNNFSRFYYIAALRKLGEYHIALSFIAEHIMELYSYNAPLLIKWHIDILYELKDLDQAQNVLKQYENFPYFSLETNEIIATLQDEVANKKRNIATAKMYDLKELDRRLFSSNRDLVWSALGYIYDNYHESYVSLLVKLMLNSQSETMKAQALIILKEKGYGEQVSINKFGKIIKVVPTKLNNPGEAKGDIELLKVINEIALQDKDVNMRNVINQVYSFQIIHNYPQVFEFKDVQLLSQIFKFISLNYMGRAKNDYKLFTTEQGIDSEMFYKLMTKYHIIEVN